MSDSGQKGKSISNHKNPGSVITGTKETVSYST